MGSSIRAPGMVVLGAVVLITLAGVQGSEVMDSQPAARRCYWCGPLAEQVHRSERAEPCGPKPRQGPCDSPDHFCATIASAPPYAESRLCVKEFRETCFAVFCNTTSVWKVVCTCRGDLCNGPVTQEAAFAFHVLTALNASSSDTKSLVKREAISLHEHSHDTDIVNHFTTFSPQPAMPTDKPTATAAAAGDNKLVPNVDNAALQDIAKEGHVAPDGMNQQSDEPSREHVDNDNVSVKAAETTAAAMHAAVDPDHQHRGHEHGVMTTHSAQGNHPDDLAVLFNQMAQGADTPKNDAQQPDDLTAVFNQMAQGVDADAPKNDAQQMSLAFDVFSIISITFSLLLYNNNNNE